MARFEVVVLAESPGPQRIKQLQPPVRKRFWEKLYELCESPFANSERAGFFAPQGGQVFRFMIEIEGWRFYFTVVFKFADSKDENTLLVSDILIREIS